MVNWRQTLYTIWFTQFIACAGFSFVSPFLPYYVQELGIRDVSQAALWAGFSTSALAAGSAVMAPIWGAISDRHGRKLMVLRATFAGVVVMALMGLVVSVQQLVFLRLVQGILTGTIAASTTLVASIAPPERRGAALGSLQTAIFLGTTLGPLFGGLSSEAFGYRQSFWVTGGLLLISGVLVLFFVHEDFQRAAVATSRRRGGFIRNLTLVMGSGALVAVLVARTVLRSGTIVTTPAMALLVQSLLPGGAHAALFTGLAFGASAIGGAIGSPLIGGLGDKWGHRPLLIASGLMAAILYIPQASAPSASWFVFWQLVSGFAVGGTLSTLSALLAQCTPSGREGVIFGLDASATGVANSIGPMLGAAAAASFALRAPFIVAAAVLALGTLVVVIWVRPDPAGLPGDGGSAQLATPAAQPDVQPNTD